MSMRIVYLLVILGIHSLGFCQDLPSDWSNIDANLLNKHINLEVNKLRKKAKKDSLAVDHSLENAAKDHSQYLAQNKILTHSQKSKAKASPKNRVEFYEGSYGSVAENIQFINKNLPLKLKGEKTATPISDYERLAKSLVLNWKKSKGHYENMIGTDYTNTFTSVSIDPETGGLYAVQLFGNTPYIYPKEVLRKPKFKPTNSKKCRRVYEFKPLSKKYGGLYVKNDSIFFHSDSRRNFRKTIWRWDDGIAADIVLKDQIRCDQENLMNGGSGQQGFLLEPVYAPQRGKSNIKFWFTPYKTDVYVYLGQIPEWVDQEYEVNLALINKKRPCIPIVYYQYSGEFWNYLPILAKMDTLSVYQKQNQLTTMNFKVYFPKNGTESSSELIRPITDSLANISGEIMEAKIASFSSIEGSKLKNIELQNARGQLLLNLLNSSQSKPLNRIEINAFENYADFYTEIGNTKWSYLKELDPVSLKKEINTNKSLKDSLEVILNQHRYAKCELQIRHQTTIEWNVNRALNLYNEAFADKDIKKLKIAQNVMYRFVTLDSIEPSQFYELPIPEDEKFASIACNKLLFKLQLDSLNKNALYECEKELDTLRQLYPDHKSINTNYANLVLSRLGAQPKSNRKQKNRTNPVQFLKSLKNIDKKWAPSLLINAHMINIEYYFYTRDYSALTSELKALYRSAYKSKLTNEEHFRIGKMFSSYLMFEESYYFLKKAAKVQEPKAEHLLYLTKVLYALNDELKKKEIAKYIELAASIAGEDFCKYFNSPNLNFQVLNDLVFKSVYCEYCTSK